MSVILRRQAKLVIGVPLVGAVLVALAAVVVPPTYTATAQLQVEPTEAEIAAGLLASVVDSHITTMTSEARLRDVLASLPDPQESASPSHEPEAGPVVALRRTLHTFSRSAVSLLKDAAGRSEPAEADRGHTGGKGAGEGGDIGVGAVKAALLVRQERQSNVLSVSYKNSDPQRAALIANRIVSTHIEELQNRRRLEADRLRIALDGRIEATRERLTEAEQAARSFYAARGAVTGPSPDGNGSASLEHEFAYVRSALDRLAASDGTGEAGPSANAGAVRDRTHDIRLLTLQAAALERQMEERRTVVGNLLGQQLDRQDVEGRIASIRRLVEDLERRRDEVADRTRPYAASANVFALAAVPARPSSPSPLLLIPPGIFAFGLLGFVAAVLRERMDRSFRTARDVGQALGVPCLGTTLKSPAFRRTGSAQQACEQSFGSVALGALHAIGRRRPVQLVLVTAARSELDSQNLAAGLAAAAGALGRRVLLIDRAKEGSLVPPDASVGEGRTIPIGDNGPAIMIEREPSGTFDRAIVDRNPDEVIRALAGESLDTVLDMLSPAYDLVLIDGPPVMISIEVRLLAARADEVVFALAWGRTRQETAIDALDLLREFAVLGGSSSPNVLAVLTGAPTRFSA